MITLTGRFERLDGTPDRGEVRVQPVVAATDVTPRSALVTQAPVVLTVADRRSGTVLDVSPDWSRWPLLIAAVVAIGVRRHRHPRQVVGGRGGRVHPCGQRPAIRIWYTVYA